jgi:hypothetical protein
MSHNRRVGRGYAQPSKDGWSVWLKRPRSGRRRKTKRRSRDTVGTRLKKMVVRLALIWAESHSGTKLVF